MPVLKETHLGQNTIVNVNRTKKGSPASPPLPDTRLQSGGIGIVPRLGSGVPAATLEPDTCVKLGGVDIVSQPASVAPAVRPEPGTIGATAVPCIDIRTIVYIIWCTVLEDSHRTGLLVLFSENTNYGSLTSLHSSLLILHEALDEDPGDSSSRITIA